MVEAALQGRIDTAAEQGQKRIVFTTRAVSSSKGADTDKTPLAGDNQFIEERIFLLG